MRTNITKAIARDTELPAGQKELIVRDSHTRGLSLRIRPSSRTWLLITTKHGKRAKITLGPWPSMTVDDARQAAAVHIAAAAQGRDLVAEAKAAAARGILFGDLISDFLEFKERGSGHRKALKASTMRDMRTYLQERCKPLHGRALLDMKRSEISAFLDRIASQHTATVSDRTRAALSSYWSWLMQRIDDIDSHIVLAVARPAPVVKRDRVLDDSELLAIWRATDAASDFNRIVRLLILTGLRWAEIANLEWDEVKADHLAIDGARTKNRLPVRQPLSDLAQAELARVSRGRHDTVFGTRGTGFHYSSKCKRQLDKASGVTGWRLHDLRRSFSTKLNELGCPPWLVEDLLNHVRPGVMGIYNRSDHADAKAEAAQQMADHIKGLRPRSPLKVVASQ